MTQTSRITAFVAVLSLLLAGGCSRSGARTAEVVGHKTDDKKLQEVRLLSATALVFLEEVFGSRLQRVPRIEMFTDPSDMAKAVRRAPRYARLTEDEAVRITRNISGLAIRDEVILVNLNRAGLEESDNLLGLLTHELTHAYQFQLAGSRRVPILMWFAEGQALLMSALMRERKTSGRYSWFKDQHVAAIRRAVETGRALPALQELEGIVDPRGEPYFPPAVVQGISFLAVDLAHSLYGMASLTRFVTLFETGDNTHENFEIAFGASYGEFVARWNQHVNGLLGK